VPDISSYECNTYIPLIFYSSSSSCLHVIINGCYGRFFTQQRFNRYFTSENLYKITFTKEGHEDLTLFIGGYSIFVLETNQNLVPLVLRCVDKRSLIWDSNFTYVVNRVLLESLSSNFYYSRLKSVIRHFGKSNDIVFTSDIKRLCFSFIPRVEHKTVSELIEGLNHLTEQTLEKRFPTLVSTESSTESFTESLAEPLTESQNFEENIIIEESIEESIEEPLEEAVINLREQATVILTSEEAVQHINIPQNNYLI